MGRPTQAYPWLRHCGKVMGLGLPRGLGLPLRPWLKVLREISSAEDMEAVCSGMYLEDDMEEDWHGGGWVFEWMYMCLWAYLWFDKKLGSSKIRTPRLLFCRLTRYPLGYTDWQFVSSFSKQTSCMSLPSDAKLMLLFWSEREDCFAQKVYLKTYAGFWAASSSLECNINNTDLR